MKHLGDISKINGAGVAPVDIITFGSPCQDLSAAGKQAGLEGSRSGLFREAVRIIKEMRDATNGKQPRFAVWENVPGAFSSNKGADFQTVLLELCRITESKAPAVAIPKAGWPPAGQLTDVGGGGIAWRTIDAQFHGVPQRRRRIILVCDFTGQRAGRILFKPSGLPGYPAEGVCEGETPAGAAAVCADGAVLCFNGRQDPVNGPVAGALDATMPQAQCVAFAYKASPASGSVAAAVDTAPTLLAGRNDAAVCLQGSMIGRADKNGPNGAGLAKDVSFTLTAVDRHAVVVENHPQGSRMSIREDGTVQTLTRQMGTGGGNAPLVMLEDNLNATYTVRRLTPTECARLQGFPDWWAELPVLDDMTDGDFAFWQEVRATYAEINGKKYKPVTKRQMIRWYNRLHTDSAEYKMWGNGVALPVVRIPLHGMAQLGAKTMGSLFDGSGGFPLAGLLDGIETLWASEIEPYPIAVTEWNFSGKAQLLLGGITDE